jgi:hypothetical protein
MTLDEAYDLAVQSKNPVLLLAEEQGTFGTPGKNYYWYPWISIQGLGPFCLFYMNLIFPPPTSVKASNELFIKYLSTLTIIGSIFVDGKDSNHVKFENIMVRGQAESREPLFSVLTEEGDTPLKITFYYTTWTANAGQLAFSSINNGGTLTCDMDHNSWTGIHDGLTNLMSFQQTSGTTTITSLCSSYTFEDSPLVGINTKTNHNDLETSKGSVLYYEMSGGVMHRLINVQSIVCDGSAHATSLILRGDCLFHSSVYELSTTVGTGSDYIVDMSDSSKVIEKKTNEMVNNSTQSQNSLVDVRLKGNATYNEEKSGVTVNGNVNDTVMLNLVISDTASLKTTSNNCSYVNQGTGLNISNIINDDGTFELTTLEERNSNPNSGVTLLHQENHGGNIVMNMSRAVYTSTMDGVCYDLNQPSNTKSFETSESWTGSNFVGRIVRKVSSGNCTIVNSDNTCEASSINPLVSHTATDSGCIRISSDNYIGNNLGTGGIFHCDASDDAILQNMLSATKIESSSITTHPIITTATNNANLETSIENIDVTSLNGAVLSQDISDNVISKFNMNVKNISRNVHNMKNNLHNMKNNLHEEEMIPISPVKLSDTSYGTSSVSVTGNLRIFSSPVVSSSDKSLLKVSAIDVNVNGVVPTIGRNKNGSVVGNDIMGQKTLLLATNVVFDNLDVGDTLAYNINVDNVGDFALDYSGSNIYLPLPNSMAIQESISNVLNYTRTLKDVKVNAERGIMRTVENASGVTTASGNSWIQCQNSTYPLVQNVFHDNTQEVLIKEKNVYIGQSESECCSMSLFGSANVSNTVSNCTLKNTSNSGGFTSKRECMGTSKLTENSNGNTFYANKMDNTSEDPVALKLTCMDQSVHTRNSTGNSIFTDGGAVHNSTKNESISFNQPTGTLYFNLSPTTIPLVKTDSEGSSNYVSNPVAQIVNSVNVNSIFERSAKEDSTSTTTASSQIITNNDPTGQSFVNSVNVQDNGTCTNTMTSAIISNPGHGDNINNQGSGTCVHANNGVVGNLGGTFYTANTAGESNTTSINANVTANTGGQLCNATCTDNSTFLKTDVTSTLISYSSDKPAYQIDSSSSQNVVVQQNVASLQQRGGEDCDVSLFDLSGTSEKAIVSDVANTTFTSNTNNALQNLNNVDAIHINTQLLNAQGHGYTTTSTSLLSNTFNVGVPGNIITSDEQSEVGLANGNAIGQVLIERIPLPTDEVVKSNSNSLNGQTVLTGITGNFTNAATKNCPLVISGENCALFGNSDVIGGIVVETKSTFSTGIPSINA